MADSILSIRRAALDAACGYAFGSGSNCGPCSMCDKLIRNVHAVLRSCHSFTLVSRCNGQFKLCTLIGRDRTTWGNRTVACQRGCDSCGSGDRVIDKDFRTINLKRCSCVTLTSAAVDTNAEVVSIVSKCCIVLRNTECMDSCACCDCVTVSV